jgi:hypothetical protein
MDVPTGAGASTPAFGLLHLGNVNVMLDQFDNPPLELIYSQASASETIDLGDVAIHMEVNNATHDCTANVVLRFLPRMGLEFVCVLMDESKDFGTELRNHLKRPIERSGGTREGCRRA